MDSVTIQRVVLQHEKDIRRLTATVAAQTDALRNVGTALRVIEARTRRTQITLTDIATGATEVTVAWDQAYPDGSYLVIPTIVCGPGAQGLLTAGLKAGSKTVELCVVQVVNRTGGVVPVASLDVLAIRT